MLVVGDRHRARDAGARARGAERRARGRHRCRHLDRHVLPLDGRLPRRRRVRRHLRLAARRASWPGSRAPRGLSGGANIRPDQVHALPPAVRHDFLLAFVDALQPVFLVGAAITAVGVRARLAAARGAAAQDDARHRRGGRRYGRRISTPDDYIAALDEPRRSDIQRLDELIRETLPELEPNTDGGMLGYGRFHYRYTSGREGDASLVALSNRKQLHLALRPLRGRARLPRRALRRAAAEGEHREELRALQAGERRRPRRPARPARRGRPHRLPGLRLPERSSTA